ncbi:MAG: hypothetical protein K1X74_07005 [Pirellulales bacterium]|nr:hypothetical protein [Pirellulales bacterium]
MRIRITASALLGAVLLACVASIAWAEEAATSETKTPQVPEGWLVLEDDVWFQLADEPNLHFHRARISFLSREKAEAANNIRKGGAMLKLALVNARGSAKKDLQASVFELYALAEGLKADKPVNIKLMDRVFARAHFALAKYNQEAAREHFDRNDARGAGMHLRAAAHAIEHGLAWAGDEKNASPTVEVLSAEKLAEDLIAGSQVAAMEVLKALQVVADEVARMQKLQDMFK